MKHKLNINQELEKHKFNLNYNNQMDFKDFDKLVKTYYPLNKEKTRYLILFKNGYSVFYKCFYDKKNKFYCFQRESTRVF